MGQGFKRRDFDAGQEAGPVVNQTSVMLYTFPHLTREEFDDLVEELKEAGYGVEDDNVEH